MTPRLDAFARAHGDVPDPLEQLAQLSLENRQLRRQLDSLLLEARQNQEKMRRFDALERSLIAAPSLNALVQILLHDYRNRFGLDAVTLAWLDPQREILDMLPTSAGDAQHPACLLLWDTDPSQSALGALAEQPILGPWNDAYAAYFEGVPQALASVALLPLVHQGQWLGSLNLGSVDPERFGAGTRADFLARLAALAAVCLHSAMATERLKKAGLTDVLTGLHNRRYFEARCMEEVLAAQRSAAPLVCMFLDLDGFKQLNDTHGHAGGDAVLRGVARLIKAELRGSDVVARYGGEEFVALLPETPLAQGLETAERIRRAVSTQSVCLGAGQATVQVTLSIGVSLLARHTAAPSELASVLVAQADQALYAAKAAGRNRVTTLSDR